MTSREVWVRLRPLLEPALELPPEERPAYLDDVCRADAGLREEARRVLDACERARRSLGFLDSPAVELAAPLLELEVESLESSGELTPGVTVGPYLLERHLGSGGMGVVYLARDPRLDRKVALKLLPAWLPVDDVSARRLTVEAKAASRLDHPNIQTVYEIGRAPDERPFIAMAYYEGETLKDRIARGPLDVGAAQDMARQMAEGLGAAHRHGIVHRDVKPGNVIVTRAGLAKVLDFGAAKIAGGRGPDRGSRAIGTVAYMSPEQTRGEDVDARTDVWSLGVVIYELLTGGRPFTGDDVEAVMRAVRDAEPVPVGILRPDVPEALALVVDRCLEKDPEARFADAGAVAEALERSTEGPLVPSRQAQTRAWRWSGVATLIGATVLGAAALWPDGAPFPGVEADPAVADGSEVDPAASGVGVEPARRLAILPLGLEAERPEDAYLAEAMTEELIADLHGVEGLDVSAYGQVVPYGGSNGSVDEIARILGVETVVTGSVREAGADIHLSLRLLDPASGESLWSDDSVTPFSEWPSLQRRLVGEVAEAVGLPPPRAPGHLAEPSGPSAGEVLRLFWRGQHYLHMLATAGASQQALEYFDEAIRLDSTYAPAWAGRSGAWHQLAVEDQYPSEVAEPIAIESAERALALDSTLADAHNHLAGALSWFGWNAEEAERHFRRAIELEPRSARAHRFFAVHLRNHRRFDEALDYIRAGTDLDPLSPGAYLQTGLILGFMGRHREAIAAFRQGLSIVPDYRTMYFYIALSHVEMGRFDAALAALDSLELDGGAPMSNQGLRAAVLIEMGGRDVAREALAGLESREPSGTVLFQRASIHSTLGELDVAIDLLERAIERRAWQLQMLAVVPSFAPFRYSEEYRPRFNALLEELGLPTL